MNCREGDLAIFLRGPNRDRMCRVLTPFEPDPIARKVASIEGPRWTIVMLQSGVMGFHGDHPVSAGAEGWSPDRNLRPIRDPGDDAVDEMVLLKGKPGDAPSEEMSRELEEVA